MRKIICFLGLIFILSVSCDELITTHEVFKEKKKDIQDKSDEGQTVNFDDIEDYEVEELMDISTYILLPEGSKVAEEEMNVRSFVSETAQVVNNEAGYVVMAENAEGKTMLLGYALPPEQVKKSLSHKSQLIASKATYNNSEISCRSTMLALVMMSIGDIGDIDCAIAMTKVLGHSEFPELVAKFSNEFINNSLYLEEINNDTEIKKQIKKVAKEVLYELIAQELEERESSNGVEAAKYTGLLDGFNSFSSWRKYKPWNWYGEANAYNVYDAPFLAISEKSNVPITEKLAIANPANINFIADFYDESGELQGYRYIGKNSTLVQKALNDGASQTVVLTDVDFKDGFDKNKTYKVVIRKCLENNLEKPRYEMLRLCHMLRVAESLINIVAEGNMYKVAQDVITTKEAINGIDNKLPVIAYHINLLDLKSPSNIKNILETAINILVDGFVGKKFTHKTLRIGIDSSRKLQAKISNPAGWAVMIFDTVNDFLPMRASMATTPDEVEYSFNLSQHKVFVNDVTTVSVVNVSPINGETIADNPVTFSWEGRAENFQLMMWATDDPSEIIHFPKSSSKSQNVNNLVFDKAYRWQVIAYDKDGNMKRGPIWEFTMGKGENQKPTKPVAMYPLELSNNIPLSMRFEWTKSTDPNPDDLLKYKLTYFYEKDGKTVEKVEKILEETYYDAKLKAGHTYYWKVVAIDDKGAQAPGNSYAFTTIPNTAPSKPVLIGPADDATDLNTKVDFSWNACSDVEDSNITYEITLKSEDEVKQVTTQNTSHSITLKENTIYTWYVTADDNNGGNTKSRVWSFKTKNIVPSTDIEMVTVRGGTFQMGNPDGYNSQKPVHSVTLSNYEIGKYEVTQAQWKKIMGSNPSYFKGDNLPVENVSWNDAQEFIKKLNTLTGFNYRLPTEAEWEFASRGGNQSNNYKYVGSNNAEDIGWYWDIADNTTHDIGGKKANELGIYDMAGNVNEWCSDWYGRYTSDSQINPQGPETGTCIVYRGGSFSNGTSRCEIGSRCDCDCNKDSRSKYFGFRLARSVEKPVPATHIRMVTVEGGTFQMGSNDNQFDEKPMHSVTLNSFELGIYEITQAQWKAVMGSNPSHFKGDNLPVEQVSWEEIQIFITKYNEQTGKNYRLPTEAEWEFAARGGNLSKGYKYAGSNTLEDIAWYDSDTTHEVGTKQPNELDIYDMIGNVYEWCSDWYDSSYYSDSPTNNPQGPASGYIHSIRGLAWDTPAKYCRITDRNCGVVKSDNLGFRLARSL